MASPSITQFFKAQRKRPRVVGKDDVGTMGTKKLLLEDGVVSKLGGEEVMSKSVKVEEVAPVKVELVNTDKSKSIEERKKKKATGGTSKKKSSKTAETGSGETKISSFAKPVKARTEEVEEVKEKETVQEPEKSQDGGNDETNLVVELPPPAMTILNKVTASPVKFLKLGPLSPAKKKKMTAQQVAKILKGKNKLSELQAALANVNQCRKNIEEFRRKGETTRTMSPLKPATVQVGGMGSASKTGINASQFYSPTADRNLKADLERLSASKVTNSPSKLVNMNNKVKKRLFDQDQLNKSDKKVPAYQRFHNLAEKTSVEKGISAGEADLPLPYHFKILKELFIAVETVAGIMKQRKEVIVFPKLKAGVLELVRKVGLREKHLAQMVTVLPDCYKFSLEKVGKENHIKVEVEELIPSVVCERRKAFHEALIKICLEHHQKFLLGLVPPIVVPTDKQITRWHPSFKVDEVPNIVPEENALPVKPEPEKTASARDVIAKAQNILENANPRMKEALKNMLSEQTQAEDKAAGVSVQASALKPAQPAAAKSIKGVSQSLLEKIRNREKQKLLNEMTRSPAESKKLQMMKKLPNFVKIVRNMMVAEKKVALPMDTVIDRVSHSIQNISPGDTAAHIRLLVTLLPNWVKIVKLSHSETEYVRIDKNLDINALLDELAEIIKKHSS